MKLQRRQKHSDDYLDLIKAFPLRIIKSERELDAAAQVALQLATKGEDALSEGEAAYLDVLDRLIEDYENEHHHLLERDGTVHERLQMLVKEAGMSVSDLGRLLGNRSLGSLVLTGKRDLSKAHIRVLAAHFHIEAGYFL